MQPLNLEANMGIRVPSLLFSLLVLPLIGAERAPLRPIDLNSATVTELMQLPRVGAKTAERMVQFRKQHGGYRRIEEVMNVQGIGEKSFVRLRPFLTVSHPAPAAVGASTSKR